ncbi:hypothetical protein POX17_26015, partial [Klebsiella pneumoniae]
PFRALVLPRLACALNVPLFVHFVQTVQTPPALAWRGKSDASKIVQICALFCAMIFKRMLYVAKSERIYYG